MYIKLTKLDGTPIWFNAAFVVTVEPRKLGGAIVVPIGDGLDYDVRETAEQVLALLEGAPVPTVVPVPPPKSLAPTPADVSPDDSTVAAPAAENPPAPAAPAKKTRGRAKKASDGAEKPAKKTRSRAKKDAAEPAPAEAAESAAEAPAPAVPAAEPAPAAAPAQTLTDEQVERLKKMAPRSMKKLANTLYSQFRVKDVEAVVATLAAKGVFAIAQDRVLWAYAPAPTMTV